MKFSNLSRKILYYVEILQVQIISIHQWKGLIPMKASVKCISVIVLLCVTSAFAADWPQWRGPNRNGKSADNGLLKEWPNDGPPLAWKIDKLGGG
jgi:hypothetical protein